MSTYIQGVQGTQQQVPFEATLPRSNYQFLQTQLDRANAMYESGLQDVKSGYASIVNAPVTGMAATARKDTYLKEAQKKLRTISNKDLSLPQNVVQAEAAYAPFWEDDLLVMNSGATRKLGKINSQLDSWLYSTDPDVKSQYSDNNRRAVQIATEKLANAPMTQEAYRTILTDIDKARAVPYYDINTDIEKAFKDAYGNDGSKMYGTTTLSGDSMITQYNGPASTSAYASFYLSKIADPKYKAQLEQQAWVEVEERRKKVAYENPSVSSEQVDNLLAKDRMKELQEVANSQVSAYSDVASYYSRLLDDAKLQLKENKGVYTPDLQARMALYQRNMQDYLSLADSTKLQYKNFFEKDASGNVNPKYYETLSDIASNPVGYVANINANSLATTWAQGRSSITAAPKIEENPLMKAYYERLDKEWTRKIDIEKIKVDREKNLLTARGQDDDLLIATGIKNRYTGEVDSRFKGGANPWAGSEDWTGSVPQGTMGALTIDPKHLDVLTEAQKAIDKPLGDMASVLTNVVNENAFGTIVLGDDGLKLTQPEMNEFADYYKGMLSGPQTVSSPVWNKVKQKLKDEGIIKSTSDITGPGTMKAALVSYSSKIADALRETQSSPNRIKAEALGKQVDHMRTLADQHRTSQEAFDKDVLSVVKKDKRFEKLLVNENGKSRLPSVKDFERVLPSVEAIDENGNRVTLSAKDMAEEFEAGTLTNKVQIGTGAHTLTVKGKTYTVPNRPFHPVEQENYRKIEDALFTLEKRFGSSDEYLKTKQQASAVAAGTLKLPGVTNDGVIYKTSSYDPNDADTKVSKFTADMGKELGILSNVSNIYSYEGKDKSILNPADAAANTDINNIRSVLRSEDDIKSYIAAISPVLGTNLVEVTFKADITGNKSEAEKSKYEKYSGKSFFFELSPNHQAKTIKSLPTGDDYSPWAGLRTGQGYYASPASIAAGRKWSVEPATKGPNGEYTQAVVKVDLQGRNVLGQPDTIQGRTVYNLFDYTTAQIYNEINKTIDAYNRNQAVIRQAQAQQIAAKGQ